MTPERNTWIEWREPRLIPRLLGPIKPQEVKARLREVMHLYPGAYIAVITLHEGNLLSVQDGPECLASLDGRSQSRALRHIKSSRAAHAEQAP